ncbi:MAG: hypothetical protein K6E49_04290 [Lachnospiraceae bacterium]|nr:hypothetical protein [Lachnospiraceae bacterium]
MSTIRFARVFTDNAVLQRNKPIRIWGFAKKNSKVTVEFAGNKSECTADDNGRFDVTFPQMDKGGPYTLSAFDDEGGSTKSSGIMTGDVIILCGQSNMEFPMVRVKETYPAEWEGKFDKLIRAFKVTENGVFTAPLADVETGQWNELAADTIDDYSAVGYFTAKHLRLQEDVAVGLVDLTLGGVIMEAFMSPEMLEGFSDALSEAEKFKDDTYRLKVLEDNEKNAQEWLSELDKKDAGRINRFEDGCRILKDGRDIVLPDFFSDTELAGFVGSLWIARTFTVPPEYVGKKAVLWFGAITDFDHCYLNGTFIGTTDYCYPPRRYEIPEGLIKDGENTLVFRIGVEKGYGRVTPGKLYGIVFGEGIRTTDSFTEGVDGADHIEHIGGVWKYIIGCHMDPPQETVFVNWKPTALYNGMLAPLAGMSVCAFAYYQGESNCGKYTEYTELTHRFVRQIQDMWGDIPFICVQLPEFNTRMEEISFDHGEGWRGVMAAQEECTSIPGYHLVRSYGCGELNDIHPQRKEPIGRMIAEVLCDLRDQKSGGQKV